MSLNSYHTPVLLAEVGESLKIENGEKYLDATVGGGGHSQKIVEAGGVLLGIDQDPEAIEAAKKRFANCPPPSPILVVANFTEIDRIAAEHNFKPLAGILFDLGVSSHQLETPSRGFSFDREGVLDMRMSPKLSVTASDLVNGLDQNELFELFNKLGEEKYSRRIARAVCRARRIKPIETTGELVRIILRAVPTGKGPARIHPATRPFQALRIAVNDELNCLREALPKALALLRPGGRLVVVSFHSLEDGIVKRFFLDKESGGEVKLVNKKPITPAPGEVDRNPRARSAKLRIAERIEP